MSTGTYCISNPTFRLATIILSIAYAAFLIIIFLRADPEVWAILVIPTLPLLPLPFILHRASLGWIRIQEEEIEIAPSWFSRKLWGEQGKNARFDSGSELLFCRRFAYGALDGFYLILRPLSGSDQTLWSATTNSAVSRRWWSRIAVQISEAHHLKSRLVEQTVSSQGVAETDWKTGRSKIPRLVMAALIVAALSPWLGIGVRLLTPDPSRLILVGVFLWVIAGASILYAARSRGAKLPDGATTIVIFSLQFFTFYAVAVLLTGAALHR